MDGLVGLHRSLHGSVHRQGARHGATRCGAKKNMQLACCAAVGQSEPWGAQFGAVLFGTRRFHIKVSICSSSRSVLAAFGLHACTRRATFIALKTHPNSDDHPLHQCLHRHADHHHQLLSSRAATTCRRFKAVLAAHQSTSARRRLPRLPRGRAQRRGLGRQLHRVVARRAGRARPRRRPRPAAGALPEVRPVDARRARADGRHGQGERRRLAFNVPLLV